MISFLTCLCWILSCRSSNDILALSFFRWNGVCKCNSLFCRMENKSSLYTCTCSWTHMRYLAPCLWFVIILKYRHLFSLPIVCYLSANSPYFQLVFWIDLRAWRKWVFWPYFLGIRFLCCLIMFALSVSLFKSCCKI